MPVKTEDVTRRMRGMDTSQHALDRMETEGAEAAKRFPAARTICPKCQRVSINTTCPNCVVRTTPAPLGERPNQMSFGEQVVEALGEYVDAKDDYARARRGVGGEFANPDHVDKAATRLQGLLDKVKFAL